MVSTYRNKDLAEKRGLKQMLEFSGILTSVVENANITFFLGFPGITHTKSCCKWVVLYLRSHIMEISLYIWGLWGAICFDKSFCFATVSKYVFFFIGLVFLPVLLSLIGPDGTNSHRNNYDVNSTSSPSKGNY